MAELVFFRRGAEVLRFTLAANERVVLGRGDTCDVVLPDPEVSRQHVALTLTDASCALEDLSGKGTLVGGKKVPNGTLTDGGDFALGQWRAVFRATSAATGDTTFTGNATELSNPSDDAADAQLPAQVRVRGGPKETVLKLQVDAFTIGKDASNDLVLTQRFVSGRHATITRVGNRFQVVDQQSTNGTWLGALRIHEAEVPFFTTLRLGEAEVTIEPLTTSAKNTVTTYQGIIGNDPSVRQLAELIERVAPSSAAVSIFGESGTGKELVARAIHARSTRADKPFIPVNCAAISKELIESELFGHEKGSFTGAANTHRGAFEEADGGTLFLDEIGELPLEMQAKLLRALESGEIKRVGAARPMNVDARIVAATNRDLLAEARQGRFREDLYYRLCVIPLTLSPLRNRPGDVQSLAEHFVKQFSPRGQMIKLTTAAISHLQKHVWPGNVRELRNVVHRALLLRKGNSIDADDISFDQGPPPAADSFISLQKLPAGVKLDALLDAAEKAIVLAALDQNKQNREHTLKQLGMSRAVFFKRLKEWGMGTEEQ
ncbi:MAG: sigma 54-interacting transcriptional regulator [Archangium sp.]|nr:sigma 54-interacting transcriptional regulator [Archangium sp.]